MNGFSFVSPIRLSALSDITFAALFVNVMARMLDGEIPRTPIMYAIRCVIVMVFPLPAPAMISKGPSMLLTASFCGSDSPDRISFSVLAEAEQKFSSMNSPIRFSPLKNIYFC